MEKQMRAVSLILLSIALFSPAVFSEQESKEKQKDDRRIALVVGNGEYANAPLKNPANDAKGMAETLKLLGFEVMEQQNATQKEMENAIRQFGKKLEPGSVGLFYYAGHGMQVDGRNYLIPVDAVIESESDIRYEAVDAGRILGKMEDAGSQLNIVILDACRNNPFVRRFRSANAGLARMETSAGSLVAYATAPGSVAADGDGGKNGIYTKYLMEHMKTPGLTIEQVFKKVRADVMQETDAQQVPWESSSLIGEFFFASDSGSRLLQNMQTLLSVDANIKDAQVYLDGKEIGRTPLQKVKAGAGTHLLQVTKEGYENYEKNINIEPGQTHTCYVDLDIAGPTVGRLHIETRPENAQIRILNTEAPFTQDMPLKPGKYEAEISLKGWGTEKRQFTIQAGRDEILYIPLKCETQEKKEAEGLGGMKFVHIAPGRFTMGSPEKETGRFGDETQHKVILSNGFYMQTTEVTLGQWKLFVQETGYKTDAEESGTYIWSGSEWVHKRDAYWKNPGFVQDDDHPVTCISWKDAHSFAEWLSRREKKKYRLPTEAEWEYACRAGSLNAFGSGDIEKNGCADDANLEKMGWYCANAGDKTHKIAQKSPNAWGLYDMHGNVREWCADRYGMYPVLPETDPKGTASGQGRVIRGGAWCDGAEGCRSARRTRDDPGSSNSSGGFRLVLCEENSK